MIKKALSLMILPSVLAGCVCPQATEIESLQPKDKALTCKDVVMEINEAEFYRKKAEEVKYPRMDYMLNPFCYPSGYASSERGMESADARLDYLNQIYDLLGCGAPSRSAPPAPPAPMAMPQSPVPIIIQQAPPPPPAPAPVPQTREVPVPYPVPIPQYVVPPVPYPPYKETPPEFHAPTKVPVVEEEKEPEPVKVEAPKKKAASKPKPKAEKKASTSTPAVSQKPIANPLTKDTAPLCFTSVPCGPDEPPK